MVIRISETARNLEISLNLLGKEESKTAGESNQGFPAPRAQDAEERGTEPVAKRKQAVNELRSSLPKS